MKMVFSMENGRPKEKGGRLKKKKIEKREGEGTVRSAKKLSYSSHCHGGIKTTNVALNHRPSATLSTSHLW